MKLRVAGAQIPVTNNVQINVATIGRAIDFAAKERADILLTPEGSLSGYTHAFNVPEVEEGLKRVTGKAKAVNLGLALGTCFVEPGDDRCYNQIRFYASDGAYLGFHSKTLRCGSMTERPEGEITRFAVRPLRTYRLGGILIGGLICNDLWANPNCTPMPDDHLSQKLAGMGARIVFHAVNGGRRADGWHEVVWNFHESNLRMRARAGGLWIVTVDNCLPLDLRCSAPSGVLAPDGEWACRTAPQGEQCFAYTIGIDGGGSA